MNNHKFDVKKLEKLNNPKRLTVVDFEKVLSELSLTSGSILVDIGAGTGLFSEKLLSMIDHSKGFAFDISKEMIQWMKENRVPSLASKLQVGLMEESKIPLDDNLVDLVFTIVVHHELDDSENLLKDANRILKSNGKILICDWKEGAHHHFVKKESIIADLKNSGFKNIKEIDASEKLVCLIASKN